MIVAIHQPDLLPYSGFWHKMARSDLFVLAEHDQFQKHGYQRRVTMREAWCSHQLDGKPSLVPITEVLVREGWQERLADVIRGRYTGAPQWRERSGEVLDIVRGARGATLAEVNTSLILPIRDLLGITTEVTTTAPPQAKGVERLIEQVQAVGGDAYLSGSGGRAYMGEDAEARFAAAGIDLRWSAHAMSTGDSVLTLLFDHEDPMTQILATD